MKWNTETLTRTLQEMRLFGDDFLNIEVKRAAQLPRNLPTTVCAFANMPDGGSILLGIDESTNFTVTGVSNPATLLKAITSQTRNSVYPAPQLSSEVLSINNKSVLVIQVLPLEPEQRPARYHGQAYLRQSDGDYVMNSNDLQLIKNASLVATKSFASDLDAVPDTTIEDLNSDLAASFIQEARRRSRRLAKIDNDLDLLRMTKVVLPNGALSIAGLYGLGYFPQGPEPALQITAAVRMPEGLGGPRNRNIETFEGAVPDMLEEAVYWVARNADTTNLYQPNGHMMLHREFPLSAIREAITNALVHRDLSGASLNSGKAVEIRLTRDALIITSPGGLHGLSVAQLEGADLAKAPVNQRLYEIMRKVTTSDGASVIEGEGGGIAEIHRACRDNNLARPVFFDNGAEFKVIFRRQPRLTATQRKQVQQLSGGRNLPQIQQELLLSLNDGRRWSITQARHYFAPLGIAEAHDQFESLAMLGLAEYRDGVLFSKGQLGNGYNSATPQSLRETGTTTPLTVPETTTALGMIEDATRVATEETTTNVGLVQESCDGPGVSGIKYPQVTSTAGRRILELLAQAPVRFPDLTASLEGLSAGQVRYALKKLQAEGIVIMDGRQGQRNTHYRLR